MARDIVRSLIQTDISIKSQLRVYLYINRYWSRRFKPLLLKEQLVAISSSHEIAEHDLRSRQEARIQRHVER